MKQLSFYLLVHHLGFVFVFYIEEKKKKKKTIRVINPPPRLTQIWFNTAGLSTYNYDFC